jgi:hypothetical protein
LTSVTMSSLFSSVLKRRIFLLIFSLVLPVATFKVGVHHISIAARLLAIVEIFIF